MKIKQIGKIPIEASRPFLIAEAGVNHEGSLSKAFEMIDAAAQAGADMIKFQSYKADTLACKNSPAYWDRRKEPTGSQYELFKKYDHFGDDDYSALAQRCREKGILFLATPFDNHFVDFFEPLMPAYKIASADINNLLLLRKIAAKKKPVILSVGAAYLSEIEEALRILESNGTEHVALLHCVLEYPTPPEDANLMSIAHLKTVFPDCTIGWSDHVKPEFGCVSLMVAWMLGAEILEKHYTLDKTLPGNDHYHAMDPDDIREFRTKQEFVQAMYGRPTATVRPGEKNARVYARRSLVADKPIPAGTPVTEDMLTAKRPGTGISPMLVDMLVGKCPKCDIQEDEMLSWDAFFSTS